MKDKHKKKRPPDPKADPHEHTLICPKCKWVQATRVPPERDKVKCCFCDREFDVVDLLNRGKLIPSFRKGKSLEGVIAERKSVARERAAERTNARHRRGVRE